MEQVSVYGASRLKHAPMWIGLRSSEPFITWTARWPDLVGHIADTPGNSSVFWRADYEGVIEADYTIVFSEANDHLRGALVEAGIALGAGKTVIVIGNNSEYGTWQYHPNVIRAESMENALWMVKFLKGGYDLS